MGAITEECLRKKDGCIGHLPPRHIIRDLVHMNPNLAVFGRHFPCTAFTNFGNAIPDTQHFLFYGTDQSTHCGHIEIQIHAREAHLNLKDSMPYTAPKATLSKALTVEKLIHLSMPFRYWRVVLKE
jgi:hypothetical protein